ncbi:hypothetical protein AB4Z09_26295, partial [Rhodococcus sp. TAF43]|uniref:hypothetical protein n=1 Tax=Rhodococcus sp. TAF43 TaxID=3237483 RepID=UPI003F9AD9F9
MTGRRTLVVEIEDLAIEDGAIPPPRVGSVIGLPLRFGESSPAAAGAVTIRAVLEPATTAPRKQYTGPDTPRRWQWHGLLRGDGWTATWRSFRPLTGQVELTGRFRAVLGDDAGRVRGLVTRIQIVTERFHSTADTHSWEILRGHRRLRDVDAAPRFFDRGAMLEQDGGEAERDIGVLVTLDLDDVSDVLTRPRIVPGAVSAAGGLLWVIDCELPLLVSIDTDRKAREHVLPGAIGPSRRIWATPTGCWVADPTGLFRCDNDDGPLQVDDLPVTAAAVLGESLFACHESGRWTLHRPGSDPIQIDAPDGRMLLCTSNSDSVFALVSGEGGSKFARIGPTGDVLIGPVLPPLPTARRRFLAGNPLRCLSDDRAVCVEPGLTLGGTHRLPRDFLSAGQVGPYVWGVH